MSEYTKEELEAGYTFIRVNGKWKKQMIPKEDLPAPPVRYTVPARAKYNAYVKEALGKGRGVIPIERWIPINYPKGIVE